MDWNSLQLLLTLSKIPVVSEASLLLGVQPVVLQRRIDKLEAIVGKRLVTRKADWIELTDAGHAVLANVTEMARYAAKVEVASPDESAVSGRVRISTTPSFASHFLISHLLPFRRKYQSIDLEIHGEYGFADSSEHDLAVQFGPFGQVPDVDDSVRAARMGMLAISLFAAPSYLQRAGRPEAADDLAGFDLVLPQPRSHWVPGMAWMAPFVDRCSAAIRVDDVAGLAAATASGYGIAALPAYIGARLGLAHVGPPAVIGRRDIWLLSSNKDESARVVLARNYLIDVLTLWSEMLAGERL